MFTPRVMFHKESWVLPSNLPNAQTWPRPTVCFGKLHVHQETWSCMQVLLQHIKWRQWCAVAVYKVSPEKPRHKWWPLLWCQDLFFLIDDVIVKETSSWEFQTPIKQHIYKVWQHCNCHSASLSHSCSPASRDGQFGISADVRFG